MMLLEVEVGTDQRIGSEPVAYWIQKGVINQTVVDAYFELSQGGVV